MLLCSIALSSLILVCECSKSCLCENSMRNVCKHVKAKKVNYSHSSYSENFPTKEIYVSRSIIIHQAFALWAYSHEGIYHGGGGGGNIYIADKPYYALWEIPKKIYPYVEATRGDVHYRGDPARTHIIRKICRQPWLKHKHTFPVIWGMKCDVTDLRIDVSAELHADLFWHCRTAVYECHCRFETAWTEHTYSF